MSETRRPFVPMRPRSPDEPHRSATPLELFFDLVFVVAIAAAASQLHHAIADDHIGEGIVRYLMVFFAIWWAWMNFTWFASAYDTDDVPYRIVTFVQLTGALILAASVPAAFESLDFRTMAAGYVVMRLALVTQWLRAARNDSLRRRTALRYAIGVSVVQVAWVTLVFHLSEWIVSGWIALVIAELAVPVWAESASPTPWHREHIAERYGLFTIIVLGESILAATIAIQQAIVDEVPLVDIAPIVIGGLLIVFSLWWIYFDLRAEDRLSTLPRAITWGYGHSLVFASAAAVGAGLAVSIDSVTGHAGIGDTAAAASVALPVVIYLGVLWALHGLLGTLGATSRIVVPVSIALILLGTGSTWSVLVTGMVLVALLAIKLVARHRTIPAIREETVA